VGEDRSDCSALLTSLGVILEMVTLLLILTEQ
jgi:hypothetical protein